MTYIAMVEPDTLQYLATTPSSSVLLDVSIYDPIYVHDGVANVGDTSSNT